MHTYFGLGFSRLKTGNKNMIWCAMKKYNISTSYMIKI